MEENINIYLPDGSVFAEVPLTESCEWREQLMTSDEGQLSWVDSMDSVIPAGSYIDRGDGERYTLLEPYTPVQQDECTWKYAPVFQSRVMGWGKVPFFHYNADGTREPDWTLTDTPVNVMESVRKAILNETGEEWEVIVLDLPNTAKAHSFQSLDILSALSTIAQTFETEWYAHKATDTLYLGRVELGGARTLTVGEEVGVPSVSSQVTEYYNRFYAFGSTRNITQDFQGSDTITQVNKRLTLDPEIFPDGYLDNPYPITGPVLSAVLFFEDVYPHSDLTISDVRKRLMYRLDDDGNKIQTGTDTDGNPIYDQYAIWYFRIPNFIFDEDMVISGKPLSVHFKTGTLLGGREFELTYHDKDKSLHNSDGEDFEVKAGDYEINFVEEGDLVIPTVSGIVPQDGDGIVLFNIRMPEQYVKAAQRELLEALNKKIAEMREDNNTYTFSSNPKVFHDQSLHFSIGEVITLKNGSRTVTNRILSITTKMDYTFEQTIAIGNELQRGVLDDIKEQVDTLVVGLGSNGSGSSGGYSAAQIKKLIQLYGADWFLSKTRNDRTPFDLTIGGSTYHEGWTYFGPFQSGQLMGFGGGVDNRGNGEFESIRVRSFMEIAELITNRQTVIEGDLIITEGELIDSVDENSDGTYTLHFHPQWEGYVTAQIEHNILRGIFNNITGNAPSGDGTTTIHNATYYTSWMRILTVNAAANTADVILYPDDETPAGRNFPPCAMMKVARWGNSGPEDNPKYAQRQQCFIISSTDGRMSKYFRMTKPIIDPGNVALTLGSVPEWLTKLNIDIKEGDEVLYVQKLIASQFILVDYQGRPVATIRDLGEEWKPGVKYYGGDTPDPNDGNYYRDVVGYYGCRWLCTKTGTTQPPSWNSTDWTFYLGDPSFKAEIKGGQPINPQMFKLVLTITATKMNQDVTGYILDRDVVWTRYSEDAKGNERAASDVIWATRRGGSGKTLTLTEADLDKESGVPPVCRFIANITLRDGQEPETVEFRM